MVIKLRDYQEEAKHNIFADWEEFNRVLIMSATGTGKTVMFLSVLADALAKGGRGLIVAHRRELIYQPIERAMEMELPLQFGVVMGKNDQPNAQVVVATVQSLNTNGRLQKILEFGPIDYVVIDEAHHATADTYTYVLDELPNAKVLGCTATPKRTDNTALGIIFEKVSYKVSIQDAVRMGALVPFKPLGFRLPPFIPEDWVLGERSEKVGDLLSAENVLEIVFEKWKEFAADRLTLTFTSGVSQAHSTAEYFKAQGVEAAAIDGTTKTVERDQILSDFKSGVIRCLFNCQVLTEGFDAPEISCIMMIAPTRSDLVYVQRLGRGLRTFPGKEDCIVLDFAPAEMRDLIGAGDILDGVPKRVLDQQERAEDGGVLLYGFDINSLGQAGYVDPHDIKAQVLDYLRRQQLAWTYDGVYAAATLSDTQVLCMISPEKDRIDQADELRRKGQLKDHHRPLLEWISRYRLYRIEKADKRWKACFSGYFTDFELAQDMAGTIASDHVDRRLSDKRKAWRNKPMSDGQANYLVTLGAHEQGLTSGEASQRISFALAKREVLKAEKLKANELVNSKRM